MVSINNLLLRKSCHGLTLIRVYPPAWSVAGPPFVDQISARSLLSDVILRADRRIAQLAPLWGQRRGDTMHSASLGGLTELKKWQEQITQIAAFPTCLRYQAQA